MKEDNDLRYMRFLEEEHYRLMSEEKALEKMLIRKKQERITFSSSIRYFLFSSQNWLCAHCNRRVGFSKKHASRYGYLLGHIDHIHPFSKRASYDGNINEIDNLQILCEVCNRKKGIVIEVL